MMLLAPCCRAQSCLRRGPHQQGLARERDRAHRPFRQGLCFVGRLSPGPGHGDDLRPDRRRYLRGKSRRRRHVVRRHGVDRARLRHDRKPQHGDAIGRIHHASERLREKVFAIGTNLLECAAGDLELRDGSVGIVGVPGAAERLRKWRRPRAPAGIMAAPAASEAGSRPPTISSRRPSPGPTSPMRQSLRSMSSSAAWQSRNT